MQQLLSPLPEMPRPAPPRPAAPADRHAPFGAPRGKESGVAPAEPRQHRPRAPLPVAATGGKLPTRELVMITTQLTVMLRSGLDLADAVASLARRAKRPEPRAALERLSRDIVSGHSFSDALFAQVSVFGEAFAVSVASGEATGKLIDVLGRLNTFLRNELRLKTTVRSVATYPVVLVVVAMVVLCVMVFFVLPQFGDVFRSMNVTAPPATRVLLEIGAVVRSWWWEILPAVAVGGWAAVQALRSGPARSWLDRYVLTSRLSGPVFRPLLTGRMLRLIGTMLESGATLIDAIRLSERAIPNRQFQQLFRTMDERIVAGQRLAPALEQSVCVPEGTAEMLATAEVSGQLANVMQTVGEFYEEEGEQRLRDLVRILEPAIIIVMGILVASIVLSVMLPLLDLSSTSAY